MNSTHQSLIHNKIEIEHLVPLFLYVEYSTSDLGSKDSIVHTGRPIIILKKIVFTSCFSEENFCHNATSTFSSLKTFLYSTICTRTLLQNLNSKLFQTIFVTFRQNMAEGVYCTFENTV